MVLLADNFVPIGGSSASVSRGSVATMVFAVAGLVIVVVLYLFIDMFLEWYRKERFQKNMRPKPPKKKAGKNPY